jgi:hypothetical protein
MDKFSDHHERIYSTDDETAYQLCQFGGPGSGPSRSRETQTNVWHPHRRISGTFALFLSR